MFTAKTTIPLIAGLIAFFVAYQIALPLWRDIQPFQEEEKKGKELLSTAQSRYAQAQNEITAWNNLASDVKERVGLAIPKERDMPNLLVFFDRAVQEEGVVLVSITIGDAASSSPAAYTGAGDSAAVTAASSAAHIPVTVTVRGQYDSLKAFFQRVERHLRLLDAVSFTIKPEASEQENENDSAHILEATILFNAYQL